MKVPIERRGKNLASTLDTLYGAILITGMYIWSIALAMGFGLRSLCDERKKGNRRNQHSDLTHRCFTIGRLRPHANDLGISSVVSTVILTSVLMVIVITSAYYANDILNTNMENVQFDQAIDAMLSVERIARKLMFSPHSTGTVKTSFPTTDPYVLEIGNSSILLDGEEVTSIPINVFKIQGGRNVGVSISKDYVGSDSLMLAGLGGSLSHVHTYQSGGAWVSLDYGRTRCVWSGLMQFYNGTGLELYNVVELTLVNLTAGPISPLERSRIIIENTGTVTSQMEYSGNLAIKTQLSDRESTTNLSDLGGNPNYRTLVNLSVISLKISILGGG